MPVGQRGPGCGEVTNDAVPPVDLRALAGHIDTAMVVVRPDGSTAFVTTAIEGITGFPAEHYPGGSVRDEVHPDDLDELWATVDRLAAAPDGTRVHSRIRLAAASGGWLWVDPVVTRALEVVGVGGYIVSVRPVPEVGGAERLLQDVNEPVEAQRALAASERRSRALVQHGSDVVFTFDDDLTVTSVTESVQEVLGVPVDEALAATAFANVVGADRASVDDVLQRLRDRPGATDRLRLRVRDAEGRLRWNEARITNLLELADVGEWVCNFWDVTATVRAEEENRRLLDIFELTEDPVLLIDRAGHLMYINAAGRRFFDIGDDRVPELLGRPWPLKADLNGDLAAAGMDGDDFEGWSGEVLAEGRSGITPVWLQVLAHRDVEDDIEYYSAWVRDISERKELEASLERQATHDPLTGLPNRALLFERIENAVHGLRSSGSERRVGLLFIDIDHFKVINDSLGHALGDRLLRSIGDRIRTAVRPGDTVARFGGDEFVVLCERLEDPQDAVVIAHRVESTLQVPFLVDGHDVHAAVSIGIAFADPDDPDPVAVLRDADTAMYRAKSDGRGRWVIFDDELRRQAVERQSVETALRQTRHGEDLQVHYQPVVDLGTGRIVSVEALVRWNRDGVIASPDDFIPVAEETGLIVPIGSWVLRTASGHAAEWQARPGLEHVGLAVNVSARQLLHPGFVASVAAVLDDSGIRPGTLSLEITETVLLEDVDQSRQRLEELRALGVRIAVDDFGTGYSSLTYLHHLPIDVMKLDRSFVAGVGSDPHDTAIVTAVVGLASAMGLEAVAEGIETELQLEHLRDLGCRFGQGFLLSRPVPHERLAGLLDPEAARVSVGQVGMAQDAQGVEQRPQ